MYILFIHIRIPRKLYYASQFINYLPIMNTTIQIQD